MRLGKWWVRRLLHGMRPSNKKPAKCLKELRSPCKRPTRTVIKLCWLMDKHAVSADRVVNIDETSCRLLPVRQIGWGRRGVKQAQLQGNTKEATTFMVAFSMDCGAVDMLVQIVHAGKTDTVLPEQPRPERTHHVTSENGWATTTTILQLAATLDDVMNPSKEGQAWILLWDTASIHASEATLAAMKATFPHVVLCFLPPRSTSYLQPAPMPDGPPEPELIDMPPAPASARPMSNLERCIALLLVYGRVSLFCVSCPGSQTVTRRSPFVFIFSRWPQKVLTQG